ncbi:MAG: hypothetical protein K2Q26_11655 [Bdellovibrionales bacterium]|nr:hypothetical protein [Bdellovibrionales bacterium]
MWTWVLFVLLIGAEEVASQLEVTNSHPAEIKLPRCIDDTVVLQKIANHIETHRKNSSKYAEYAAVFRGETPAELVARLAYAETIGANCSSLNSSVGPRIVEVIANRVRRRGGDARSVVFQRDQFSSSLNIYSNSRYKDFLCPKDLNLWKEMVLAARSSLENPPSRVKPDTMNYFLYRHDPRWAQEPWALKEDLAGQSEDARACVRFFRVPDWK